MFTVVVGLEASGNSRKRSPLGSVYSVIPSTVDPLVAFTGVAAAVGERAGRERAPGAGCCAESRVAPQDSSVVNASDDDVLLMCKLRDGIIGSGYTGVLVERQLVFWLWLRVPERPSARCSSRTGEGVGNSAHRSLTRAPGRTGTLRPRRNRVRVSSSVPRQSAS